MSMSNKMGIWGQEAYKRSGVTETSVPEGKTKKILILFAWRANAQEKAQPGGFDQVKSVCRFNCELS